MGCFAWMRPLACLSPFSIIPWIRSDKGPKLRSDILMLLMSRIKVPNKSFSRVKQCFILVDVVVVKLRNWWRKYHVVSHHIWQQYNWTYSAHFLLLGFGLTLCYNHKTGCKFRFECIVGWTKLTWKLRELWERRHQLQQLALLQEFVQHWDRTGSWPIRSPFFLRLLKNWSNRSPCNKNNQLIEGIWITFCWLIGF